MVKEHLLSTGVATTLGRRERFAHRRVYRIPQTRVSRPDVPPRPLLHSRRARALRATCWTRYVVCCARVCVCAIVCVCVCVRANVPCAEEGSSLAVPCNRLKYNRSFVPSNHGVRLTFVSSTGAYHHRFVLRFGSSSFCSPVRCGLSSFRSPVLAMIAAVIAAVAAYPDRTQWPASRTWSYLPRQYTW